MIEGFRFEAEVEEVGPVPWGGGGGEVGLGWEVRERGRCCCFH